MYGEIFRRENLFSVDLDWFTGLYIHKICSLRIQALDYTLLVSMFWRSLTHLALWVRNKAHTWPVWEEKIANGSRSSKLAGVDEWQGSFDRMGLLPIRLVSRMNVFHGLNAHVLQRYPWLTPHGSTPTLPHSQLHCMQQLQLSSWMIDWKHHHLLDWLVISLFKFAGFLSSWTLRFAFQTCQSKFWRFLILLNFFWHK